MRKQQWEIQIISRKFWNNRKFQNNAISDVNKFHLAMWSWLKPYKHVSLKFPLDPCICWSVDRTILSCLSIMLILICIFLLLACIYWFHVESCCICEHHSSNKLTLEKELKAFHLDIHKVDKTSNSDEIFHLNLSKAIIYQNI